MRKLVACMLSLLCLTVIATAAATEQGVEAQLQLFDELFQKVRTDHYTVTDDAALLAAAYRGIIARHPPAAAGNWAMPAAGNRSSGVEAFHAAFAKLVASGNTGAGAGQLMQAAIDAMLTSLDPQNHYIPRKEFQELQTLTQAETGSVGIKVTLQDGQVRVIAPIGDMPAARAGLQPGDTITHIDGKDVAGLTLVQAGELMLGASGTAVTLRLLKAHDGEALEVALTREPFKLGLVATKVLGTIGYFRINTLNEGVVGRVEAEVERVRDIIGSGFRGAILDLRNNPGGHRDVAIEMADLFLEDGEIATALGRAPRKRESVAATPGDILEGLPIAVLVNEGTVEEAEVLAGALQSRGRGKLVGQNTFGGGTEKSMFLINGGALMLNTHQFALPDGRFIEGDGLAPDVAVRTATWRRAPISGDPAEDEQLQAAINLLDPPGKIARDNFVPTPDPAPEVAPVPARKPSQQSKPTQGGQAVKRTEPLQVTRVEPDPNSDITPPESRGALTVKLSGAEVASPLYDNSHALVIGIDDYSGGWPRLSNAINDARAVAAALEARGFGVELVTNPDSDQLEDAVERFVFEKGADPGARLFIWFAGHGHTINGEGYLVPARAPGPEAGWKFRRAALSLRSFGRYMREVQSKHVLAVFDSCFAGTIFNTARSLPSAVIDRATTQPVRQFVSSGEAEQVVSDDGTFRKLFIAALDGLEPNADANRDGYITGSELGLFLSDKVTTLSDGRQTPRYGKLSALALDRGDFVFAVENDEVPTTDVPKNAPAAELDNEALFWASIKDSDDIADFEEFLKHFPDGTFSGLAKRKLARLKR